MLIDILYFFIFNIVVYFVYKIYKYKKFVKDTELSIDDINNYNVTMRKKYGNDFIYLNIGITDQKLLVNLQNEYPLLYLTTQKLLVGVEKYLYKNDNIDFNNYFNLFIEYIKSSYSISNNDLKQLKIQSIIYLNEFSKAFPNWKKEYIFLNSYVHNIEIDDEKK